MRTNRLQRSATLLAAAGKGAVRAGLAKLPGKDGQRRKQEAMIRTAEDVAKIMGDMKGVTMKVGQIMSLMGGAVTEEFAGRLASLQSAAPPMVPELVDKVFLEDFGRRPDELFRSFETRPFAAASIGQVHRAALQDGTQVAVKVQYPGVGQAIAADLANLNSVFGLAGLIAKGFDPGPMVEDLQSGISNELDYSLEASRQQRFADIFRGHPFVRVPQVFAEVSSGRVLVQEYIDGRPFSTAQDLPQKDRDRIAEIIFRFTFGCMHRLGLFQADPHAGNYLLLDNGKVAFLDFGCISEFSEELLANINGVVAGVLTEDIERWRRGMEVIGYIPAGLELGTDELWQQMRIYYKFILADGVTFTPELSAAMIRQNLSLSGEAGRVNRQMTIPPGVVFIQRITFGFTGLMASIRASGPWRSITEEYVLGAPPSTELGRLSAMSGPEGNV